MDEDDEHGQLGLARSNRYLALVRRRVPEFEPRFAVLVAGDPEVGSFEAISEFARWVARNDDVEVLRRAFRAIDDAELESEHQRWNEASSLSGEFCGALRDAARSLEPYEEYMGPWVRAHAAYAHGDAPRPSFLRRVRGFFSW